MDQRAALGSSLAAQSSRRALSARSGSISLRRRLGVSTRVQTFLATRERCTATFRARDRIRWVCSTAIEESP